MIVLREIGNAEAERHRLEEGRNRHGNTLCAIPVADMEDRVVHPGRRRSAIERALRRDPAVQQDRAVRALHLDPQPCGGGAARDVEDVDRDAAQLNRTYSKLPGWLLMPRVGGAIQLAYLPGSITAGPI